MTRPAATNRALQKLIFAACRQLGLDDEERRDLQVVVTGKSSMTDMSEADMRKLADRLKELGGVKPGRRPAAPRADLRYIHALWGNLGRAGKLRKPDRAGLNAFVRARFEGKWASVPLDIDMLQDAGQINDVTRALKDWCVREDVPTEKDARR